jgi:septal ring-binding cell division protein DamX
MNTPLFHRTSSDRRQRALPRLSLAVAALLLLMGAVVPAVAFDDSANGGNGRVDQGKTSSNRLRPPVVMMPAEVIAAPATTEPAAENAVRTAAPEKQTPAAAPAASSARPSTFVRSESLRSRYEEMAKTYAAQATGEVTLQLEIACESASLTSAIRAGGDNVWFVPFPYRGRSCYRVFWGHYASEERARRSVAEVPGELRGTSRLIAVRVPPRGTLRVSSR